MLHARRLLEEKDNRAKDIGANGVSDPLNSTWPLKGHSSSSKRPESPEQRLAVGAALWLGDLLEDEEVAKQLNRLMEAVAAAAAVPRGSKSRAGGLAAMKDSLKKNSVGLPRRRRASIAGVFASDSKSSSAAGAVATDDALASAPEHLDEHAGDRKAHQRGR